MLCNTIGGDVKFRLFQHHEGVQANVISVTGRGVSNFHNKSIT